MNPTTAELNLLLPEIFVLIMACLILLLEVFLSEKLRPLIYQLAQATLAGAAALSLLVAPGGAVIALHGTFISDPLALILKLFIYLVVFTVFLYSRQYLQDRGLLKGEYFVLALFAVLGMMVMVSSHNLITLYLGLELLSLSMYSLVAMQRDNPLATEAAMKYFVLGALASGMLLYGMSMIYGVTGSLDFTKISEAVDLGTIDHSVLAYGLVFLIVGVAFKFGAVPFHMWVPDIYQGAPTAITLFIGSAPKLAAFAMLMRLLVDGLEGLYLDWQGILILLSILSMFTGNILAIAQTNIKRMLAYSTISHVGYLLLGVLTASHSGYAASLFYTISYTLMSLGAFGMVLLLSRAGYEAENLDDFKGLNTRKPWYAFIMLIIMLSMAGVPPMLGFWAKWSVLGQVVQAGMVWLAVLAVLAAVIGAFYYLRIVKLMYFDAPQDTSELNPAPDLRFALSVNGLAVLMLGLSPQALMEMCAVALV